MALTNIGRKVTHAGNGSATVFPYDFPILSDAHLSVILTDVAGVETTLSPSLYAATGVGTLGGGAVTYPLAGAGLAAGTKLTIVRTVPYTQTTVLSNQGGYYPEVVERRFDEIYMAMQQLAEIVGRTTVGSISDPATEQSNYALIQSLQAFRGDIDKLTTSGDLLTRDGSGYKRLPRGTSGQFLGISGADAAWQTPAYPAFSGRRQTVSSGPVTAGGLPNFLPATTGTLTLQSTNLSPTYPMVATAAAGWSAATGAPVDTIGVATGPLTWTGLAANRAAATPNFLYVTVAGGILTTGSTLLPPVYQLGGTPSVTNGQFTFNIAEMRGYLGTGTSAPQVNLVMVGEAATDSTSVASTVGYAFNARYDSGYSATLPAVNTSTSRSHYLGVVPQIGDFRAQCASADAGYSIGDEIGGSSLWTDDGAVNTALTFRVSRNDMGVIVSTNVVVLHKTTGVRTILVRNRWQWRQIAERGW
ncbi:hypothetical protein [Reyranella sp.]|uniref:hypothetical protein n=1 Tax=Reyranella sp. TaxID=1929291 RepID=UPI003BAB4E15